MISSTRADVANPLKGVRQCNCAYTSKELLRCSASWTVTAVCAAAATAATAAYTEPFLQALPLADEYHSLQFCSAMQFK
jgi:hypothetical protein